MERLSMLYYKRMGEIFLCVESLQQQFGKKGFPLERVDFAT